MNDGGLKGFNLTSKYIVNKNQEIRKKQSMTENICYNKNYTKKIGPLGREGFKELIKEFKNRKIDLQSPILKIVLFCYLNDVLQKSP